MKKGKESVVHRCCAQTPISVNLTYFSCLIQVCFKAFSVRKIGIHVLERTATLYINQYCNFPVDITSLEFLYPHGVGCLHSQLQIGKIAKKKDLPCFWNINVSKLPSPMLSFLGNLVICLFLLKYVISLLNMTSLFMQGITSSGHLKILPQNTNIKRILSYNCTVKGVNVVTLIVLHGFDIW